MRYILSFLLSIVLTSLAYFIGGYVLTSGIAFWEAILIGSSVVAIGAFVEKMRAPMWLIILTPFPVGMILLYLLLKEPFVIWLLTYLIILTIYTIIHVFMSYFFRFHSLIPAWKLSK